MFSLVSLPSPPLLGIECRTSHMIGKHSCTKLYPEPLNFPPLYNILPALEKSNPTKYKKNYIS